MDSLPIIALLQELDDLEDAAVAAWAAHCAVEYPLIPNVRVDLSSYPDVDALDDYRFTCLQLQELSEVMRIPQVFFSGAGDRILGVEALAMLCYRLSYPGKLSKIRKQFGRSDASCSRIITDLYCFLDDKWSQVLFFNDRVYDARYEDYVHAISRKTRGLAEGVSMFIDGTKGFICRPEPPKGLLQWSQAASLLELSRRLYAGWIVYFFLWSG